MKSGILAAALAAHLLANPLAALAQEEAIGLPAAVAEALRANDLVSAEDRRLETAEQDVRLARSRLLPSVTAEERLVRTDNPAYDFSYKINQGAFSPADLGGAPGTFNDPAAITDYQTSLTLSQPLFSRRAALGVRMARSEAGAVALDVARSRETVARDTARAWLGARAAEAALAAAVEAEADAAEHRRLAAATEEAGTGLASDRLRAEVALAEAGRARLAAANDLEVARRGLGLALGRETPVVAAGAGLPEAQEDLAGLLAAAGSRPDLGAMRERVANAGRAVALARAARLPEVGLTATLQANDPDHPLGTAGTSYLLGVGVSWKLFSGFASRAEEAKARAAQRRAESLLAGMDKEARFRVREAWLRREEAVAGLALAEAAQEAAAEGVRLLRVRYENGLAPMVALLDAQGALNRARADVARAGAGVAMAETELRFRAGTLLRNLGADAR